MNKQPKKPLLQERYRGYAIYRRHWLNRRPYRSAVPGRPGRGADWHTLQQARALKATRAREED